VAWQTKYLDRGDTVTKTLSPRELEVINLVKLGDENKLIAQKFGVSEQTIKNHVRHILNKIGAFNRTQAVYICLKEGIITL